MPKIDTKAWTHVPGEPNPMSGQNDGAYCEVRLGDAIGLTQFGARLERLPPGSRSSHRHWHQTEDEFVYVLSGEAVLIEDEESLLQAGDAAGWKAGAPVAHCLENRSDSDVVVLVVGHRAQDGVVHYPDHGVILRHDAEGRRYTDADGTPLSFSK